MPARPAKSTATIDTKSKNTAAEVRKTTVAVETEKVADKADKMKTEKETAAADAADKNNGLPFIVKDGKVSVLSERRAGKTVYAVSGTPIVFDAEGNATISVEDAMYLHKCPGFSFK